MKLRSISPAVLPSLLAIAIFSSGCDGSPATSDNGTSGDGGSTSGTGAAGGSGGADTGGGGSGGVPEPPKRKTLSGDVTWQVTFDATAQAAGATDCSYTRHYQAVEDRSAHWLCPTCEIMFLADVEVSAGLQDCYSQVSATAPAKQEWIGYGNGKYWRSALGPMAEQGTAMVNGTDVQTANLVQDLEAPAGGTLGFQVSGQLTLGEEEGDPLNGWLPPETYACGWPKANPPEYTGDYVLQKGGVLPDGLFHDGCDETVRLHDFKGSYLIVDMAAIDCPPCQTMASEEEQFVADLAAKGIEVHVVTLLAPSLMDVFGLTTTKMLNNWKNNFGLTSPVLGDRGWGLSIFEPAIGADTIGYPSWAVVDPDLNVLEFNTGFGDFSEMQAIIEADAQ